MLEDRQRIVEDMEKYMSAEGYQKSGKSKTSHSLDSMIFTYVNTAGISDNIKIEINYSMRVHIFPLSYRQVQTGGILEEFKVLSVEGTELFGSKIKALLDRAAPRDLYDVDNMIKYGLFHGRDERNALRKCAVFYMAVGNKETPGRVNIEAVDEITWYRIKTDLLPVKRKKEKFDLDETKQRVGWNFRLKGREDMFADYHVHTEFSDDSVYPMEQVVRDAIAGGMDEICFQTMWIMALSRIGIVGSRYCTGERNRLPMWIIWCILPGSKNWSLRLRFIVTMGTRFILENIFMQIQD